MHRPPRSPAVARLPAPVGTWDELVAAQAGRVYHLALRLTDDAQGAADLTYAVFARVHRDGLLLRPLGTIAVRLDDITIELFDERLRPRAREVSGS